VVLRADEILPADTRYTVTVSARIRAVDRTTLASAYRFGFRTRGGELLLVRALPPVAPQGSPPTTDPRTILQSVSLTPQFEAVYSREVDSDRLMSLTHLAAQHQPWTTCRDSTIPLVLAQRRVIDADGLGPEHRQAWRYVGNGSSGGIPDSLHRVVIVAPRVTLAADCKHTLALPTEVAGLHPTH
jgi:hypothetical protein